MKIVQIIPGLAESYYCENCVRDTALVKALGRQGHEVLKVPMYLPVAAEVGGSVGEAPIFFGGINVYLQQKSRLFRRTPRWLDQLFDSPRLLRWVGRRAGMTSARDLAETTISMLQGRRGRQVKELDRLIEWLGTSENKPDVVVISNVLMAGLAGPIKEQLGAAVVCFLQDEDAFLDGLREPYSKHAWQLAGERANDVDALVAVSNYYAEVMREKLQVSAEKVHVVYPGVEADQYGPAESKPEAPTLGYLSRACYDKGLDTLIEVFINLRKDAKLKKLRLRIAGGNSGHDEPFLNWLRGRVHSCGLADDVEFVDGFGHEAKLEFLRSLSVLSVPEKRPIACGLYMVEAFACGIAVVAPDSGAFSELAEAGGGGELYEPGNSEALATALKRLLVDADYAREVGSKGREAVLAKFNIEQTAEAMVKIFERVCNA
jgi:glycosyltransferase involved in cell wall biosynthesis